MATTKPTFAKMGLKVDTSTKVVAIGEQEIEVRQYLPVNEKLEMISRILNNAADDNNFANPIKLDVFTNLEIVFTYTNLQFTDKQKEDLVKLYDILESNHIFDAIIQVIPAGEYEGVLEGIDLCADAVYNYQNSIMGILENIAQNYDNLALDVTDIESKIANPENLALLRNVLGNLG